MSDLNRHSNNCHPDLPPCVCCGREDFATSETRLGHGVSIQYACPGCDLRVIYRYCGPPGVLLWALSPDDAYWQRLNVYLQEVQAYRKAAYTLDEDRDPARYVQTADPPFPAAPAGMPVHVLRDKTWERLC